MKKILILLAVFSLSFFNQETFAQEQTLPKNQFQKSLSKIQKCTGEEFGLGHTETRLGEARVFWGDNMIKATWIDSIGDSTYVTHIRALFQDGFEAEEIKEYYYYAEYMASDFLEPRTKLLTSDGYDRAFVDILKVRGCPTLWSEVVPINAPTKQKFNVVLSMVRNCFDKKSGSKTINDYGGEGNRVTLEWSNKLVRLTSFVKGENLGVTTLNVIYPEGGMESKYGYTPIGNGELYLEHDIIDFNEIDDGSNPNAWEEEVERAYVGLLKFLKEQGCR